MRFKIKEVYGQSEKTGLTKCELILTDYWLAQAMVSTTRMTLRESNPKYQNEPLPAELSVPTKFIAYAKLAEGDTFDRAIGRKVARDKAYQKYMAWAEKFTKYIRKYSAEIAETVNVNGETFED